MVTFITKYNNLQQNCGLCTLIRDLKIQGGGDGGETSLNKSEFASFQSSSRLFQLTHFAKRTRTLLDLNSQEPLKNHIQTAKENVPKCTMGLFWGGYLFFSFISYCKIAKETGSKFVLQNSPIPAIAWEQGTHATAWSSNRCAFM